MWKWTTFFIVLCSIGCLGSLFRSHGCSYLKTLNNRRSRDDLRNSNVFVHKLDNKEEALISNKRTVADPSDNICWDKLNQTPQSMASHRLRALVLISRALPMSMTISNRAILNESGGLIVVNKKWRNEILNKTRRKKVNKLYFRYKYLFINHYDQFSL